MGAVHKTLMKASLAVSNKEVFQSDGNDQNLINGKDFIFSTVPAEEVGVKECLLILVLSRSNFSA